ncbi:hypothetical protein [Hydrogenophaga intermedia]|uniref:hypothetical protein n=1 Tax=Hydrogenophaga intermedia TaxID=65786 RepID=UPI002044747B|nr:hypothetical protein [Hydrogenophaga intermedia]MCM3562683.1 hypothetical protein [Hydrogenophaga intermedia]
MRVQFGEYDVSMVRACVDAAMGMVHELKLATWPEGSEVPATSVLAMATMSDVRYLTAPEVAALHDHVDSARNRKRA